MGETGIGKTILIELLSAIMEIKFNTLKIYEDTTFQEIIDFVKTNNQICDENNNIVLFFDEINTNENIGGLLKEILVDRKLLGDKLKEFLIPIGACNPYKQKIRKNSNKIKKIKKNKSNLVYDVYPIPESMFYYVLNYNKLDEYDEKLYIKNIIELKNVKEGFIFQKSDIEKITELVWYSQEFIREKEEVYSVSLRDVKRFTELMFWFFHNENENNEIIDSCIMSYILHIKIDCHLKNLEMNINL